MSHTFKKVMNRLAQWSAISLAAGAVNNAVDSRMLLELWRTPVYQYWFLYVLVICQLVTLITRGNPWITGLLCVISAFDVWGCTRR